MDYSFKIVDDFIEKMKKEKEINDYINNGIYPDYLSSSNSPPIKFDKVNKFIQYHNIEIPNIDLSYETYLYNKIKQTEYEIKKTIEQIDRENDEIEDNKCPICYKEIKNNDFILPKCQHKICVSCFVTTLKYKGENNIKCCLCRRSINI